MIHRRNFAGMLLAAPLVATGCSAAPTGGAAPSRSSFSYLPGITTRKRLIAPKGRPIKVAFAINPGVQVIDVAGAWETFQDTLASPADDEAGR